MHFRYRNCHQAKILLMIFSVTDDTGHYSHINEKQEFSDQVRYIDKTLKDILNHGNGSVSDVNYPAQTEFFICFVI